jgi:hypothetical protein
MSVYDDSNDKVQTQEEIDADIASLVADAVLAVKDTSVKDRFQDEMKYKVIRDLWHYILEDFWAYVVVWSQPRLGKSTCKMRIANCIYHDWEMVLDSIIFNLGGLLFKMEKKLPMCVWEKKHLHYRIPMIIGDDWGANANKAKTQSEPAWDLVKGMWDTLGTAITSVFVSMNQPDEITRQLAAKYTHELYIERRGCAKWDKVSWSQNFYGWQPNQKKDWKQSFDFGEVPADIYARYDEMRCSLVDELRIQVQAKIAETETDRIMKRLGPHDYELLEAIHRLGPLTDSQIRNSPKPEIMKESLKKCRAYGLLIPLRGDTAEHRSRHDISDLGLEILNVSSLQEEEPNKLKQRLRTDD